MNPDGLAPAYVAESDLRFFARHPERQYRARRPFRSEVERLRGVPPLKPGRFHVVIVSKLTKAPPHHFMTELVTMRPDDGKPPRLPKTDPEIRRAFVRRNTPVPASVEERT